MLVVNDRHVTGPCDASNQGRVVGPAEFPHLRNCARQRLSHFSPGKIARPEVKLANPMTPERVPLDVIVTIPFVLGENNPSPLRDELKPLFVGCTTSEEVPVALMLYLVAEQAVKDRLTVVEIFIQVKDEIIKLQLLGFPSGLPLRSAFLRGHIPWLVRVPTRVH